MLPFTVISAVGVMAVRVENSMVKHLPDAAAHQIFVVIDLFPVGLNVSGTDTHGMGIFAEEVGTVIETLLVAAMLTDFVNHRGGRIHFAANVIGLAAAVDGTLIVNGQGGMRFQVIIHGIRIGVAACLIAKGPHDDRGVGMELVTVIKTLNTLQITGLPFLVMADGIITGRQLMGKGAVCFQIVFIDDIDAQFISQFKKERIRRVVGGPDGVNIVFLAQLQVFFDVPGGQRIAVFRMGIVMVDALELDRAAVDKENISLNFNTAESDAFVNAAGRRFKIQVIENRILGTPLRDLEPVKGNLGMTNAGGDGGLTMESVSLQRKGDAGGTEGIRAQVKGIRRSVIAGDGIDFNQVCWFADTKQDIPENTVVAEHVLVLQIRAGAPSVNDDQKFVGTGSQLSGEVKLGRVVRTL